MEGGNLLLSFIATSVTLNLVLTVLIARKLLGSRKTMHETMSTSNIRNGRPTDPYMSIITVVVESAAAWTIAALAYLIAIAVQDSHPVSPFDDIRHTSVVVSYFLENVYLIAVASPSVLQFLLTS